jgi:type IV pilus assembly protein PilW
MKNPVTIHHLNWQKGISLLSLMIASAIGIFLTGAALKVYIDSKNTFTTRGVVAEVVENQRFAMDDMRRILVMAGRGIRATEDALADTRLHTFPPVENDLGAASANGAESTHAGETDNGKIVASDIVAVRYRTGPSCGAYQNVPLEGKLQKRTNGTIYRDDKSCRPTTVRFKIDNNKLVCEMNHYYTRNDATGLTTCLSDDAPSYTKTVIASGIHALKVLYGVDGDNDGYASRYLTASEVGNWRDVVALRFALVAGSESELPNTARKSEAGEINVIGWTYDEPDTEHLYRSIAATLSLRNFNTTVQRQ